MPDDVQYLPMSFLDQSVNSRTVDPRILTVGRSSGADNRAGEHTSNNVSG